MSSSGRPFEGKFRFKRLGDGLGHWLEDGANYGVEAAEKRDDHYARHDALLSRDGIWRLVVRRKFRRNRLERSLVVSNTTLGIAQAGVNRFEEDQETG